jgi:response regulator RpfG family c-di-GMP phosphodiesterase
MKASEIKEKKILLVSSEKIKIELVSEILKSNSTLECIDTFKSALSFLLENKVDHVICEYNITNKTAVAFVNKLKEKKLLKHDMLIFFDDFINQNSESIIPDDFTFDDLDDLYVKLPFSSAYSEKDRLELKVSRVRNVSKISIEEITEEYIFFTIHSDDPTSIDVEKIKEVIIKESRKGEKILSGNVLESTIFENELSIIFKPKNQDIEIISNIAKSQQESQMFLYMFVKDAKG